MPRSSGPAALPWPRAAWPGEEPTGAPPPWHTWFESSWAMPRRQQDAPLDGLGLLELARPLIEAARRQLADALSGISLPVQLAALPELLPAQPPLMWLRMCVLPVMVTELAVAREAGRLHGDSPEGRFEGFVRGLSDPATALGIWRRYPMLARQVSEILTDWVAARTSFARHLTADLPRLPALSGSGGDLGTLRQVRFGGAETHRHGRTVALAEFSGGTVVYKPRNMAIDGCFDRLLEWFNDGAPRHPLRRLRVLDADDHGWSEHVAAAPCDPAGLASYFWRLGALAALTYLVHGFDLHADNVIAVGSDPVVVDTEALFHTERSQPKAEQARLGDPAAALLAHSVLVSGLLPGPLVMADVETGRPFGVDISPMGIVSVRRSLIRLPQVVNDGTDQLRLEYRYFDVPAPAGRLTAADGSDVNPASFRDDIVAGFTLAYERLAAAGEWLLSPAGPLGGCADMPVRLVQLSTFLYVRLLIESWHPDFQRRAAARQRCLSRLAGGWKGVPHRAELIGAEMAAVQRGEVPVFMTRPGSRDVWLEDGTRLPGVLGAPALEEVRGRLSQLGPAGLERQVGVIDAALAAIVPPAAAPAVAGAAAIVPPAAAPAVAGAAAHGHGTAAAGSVRSPAGTGAPAGAAGGTPGNANPLAAARQIAETLSRTAVRAGPRIGWITTEVVDARHHRITAAGLGLPGGLTGIGLFLEYLSLVTGDETATSLAAEVAGEVVRRCEAAAAFGPPRRGTTAGAFGELCAPLYYLAHAARVHGRSEYAGAAAALLLPRLAEMLGRDRAGCAPGLAEGPAGALAALLALYAVTGGAEELRLAGLAAAQVTSLAAAGETQEPGPAYGRAGAAVALGRWHAVSGETGAAAAARSLLRADPLPDSEPGWCLGAAGAGLARLECASQPAFAGESDVLGNAIARCVATAAAALPGADDSLCHGRFAIIELLASVAGAGEPGLALAPCQPAAAEALAAAVAPLVAGSPTPGEAGSPTLGEAGIPTPGEAGSPTPGEAGSPTLGEAGIPTPGEAGSPTPGEAGSPTLRGTGAAALRGVGAAALRGAGAAALGEAGAAALGEAGAAALRGAGAAASAGTVPAGTVPARPAPDATGWRPALPGPAPGLLTGLAGIGFGLLRLASPATVPSVLLFEPPRPPR
jgi:type 2 lantibiotic biosynthesis protein LanM